jgi:hypothetical protein
LGILDGRVKANVELTVRHSHLEWECVRVIPLTTTSSINVNKIGKVAFERHREEALSWAKRAAIQCEKRTLVQSRERSRYLPHNRVSLHILQLGKMKDDPVATVHNGNLVRHGRIAVTFLAIQAIFISVSKVHFVKTCP